MIRHFERYEVMGRLAVGGMAEVYLARSKQEPDARPVAIKRLLPQIANDPELVQMFFDEAQTAMRLEHPHLCKIFDFGAIDGTPCLAMEWVWGVTLEELLKRARVDGGLPLPIAIGIVLRIAEALHAIHKARDEDGWELDIVHRDVSPHNVMIGFDGGVKLLDFGLAKAVSNRAITRPGMAKGKFAYMAPEQLREDGRVDARADVFALGVCMYEMIAGLPLYQRETPIACMRAITGEPVPSLRAHDLSIPEAIDRVARRALAKDPSERWQSAGEIGLALEEWLAGEHIALHAPAIAAQVEDLFHQEMTVGPRLSPTSFGKSGKPKPKSPEAVPPSIPPATITMRPPVSGPGRTKGLVVATVAGALVLGLVAIAGAAIGGKGPRPPAVRPAPASRPAAVVAPDSLSAARSASASAAASISASPSARIADAAATTDTPARAAAPAPVAGTARLSINTRPWSEVFVNGRSIGQTPLGDVEVPAGFIRLRLVDAAGGVHFHRMRLDPEQDARLFLPLDAPDTP